MASLARRLVRSYREGWDALEPRARRIVLASFLFVGARMSVVTFLGIYLNQVVGIPLAVVGLAFLVENVARGMVAPFAGALSDRVGRKPVMLGALFATAGAMPLFLLVDGAAGLFAWSVLMGLAQGPYFPTAGALLMDLAPREKRQESLAVNYTAISLGYTVGVAPAGFLAERSFALLAGVSVALLLLVGVMLAWGLRGALPMPERSTRGVAANATLAARDPVFLAFAAPAILLPMGIGLVSQVFPVFAVERGMGEGVLGLLLSSTGVLLALMSIPMNAGAGVRGPFRKLPLAALLCAASYAFFAYGDGWVAFLVGLSVFTVGEALFSAALPTAVAALAPAGSRGAYQGAWAFLFSSGIGCAFVLSGLLRDAYGWGATWLLYAGVTLVAGGLLLLGRRHFRKTADERAAAA